MKSSTKKAMLASVFACAFATVSLGVMSFNVASAEVATDATKIAMTEGASLRLESGEGDERIPFGLRFKTDVNKAWYDTLTNPQVYTVFLPTDMLEAELTADTQNIVKADIDESKKYEVGENYRFNAVLTNVPDTAYGTEISVRSYIVADNQTAIYTPLEEGTYASRARSVVAVADAALAADAEAYGAVDKYLIAGIQTAERHIEVGSSSSAKLAFREGTSAAVQAILNEKYPLTVTSVDTQSYVTADGSTWTAESVGEAQFTVASEELGFEETVTVNAYQRAYGTLVDFNHLDTTDYVLAERASEVSVATYGGENAIKVSTLGKVVADSTSQILFTATSNLKVPEWYDKFDTVTVKAAWEADVETAQFVYAYDKAGLTCNNGEPIEITVSASGYKANLLDSTKQYVRFGGRYRYNMSNGNGNYDIPSSLYIMGLTLGINDIANQTGSTVNLYDKFHTEAGKATFTFTPTGGTASDVSDPTAFAEEADGVITATITEAGYATGTVTANYDYSELQAFGTVADFTNPDANAVTACAPGNKADISTNSYGVYDQDGVKGYYFTIDHTADTTDAGKVEFYGVQFALPAYASNFQTYSVTVKLVAATKNPNTNANVAWLLYGKNTTGTYRLTNKNVGTEVTHTGTIGDSFCESGVLMVYSKIQNANEIATATYVVTDIKLGYADVTVGDTFSWDTYGLAASELSDVTFNETVLTADQVSNFAPTEAGTLTFTVNKEGYLPATFSINVVAAATA